MARPLVWPSDPEFYPMGLLPAKSLIQDLSPEQPADILLLGCGDPRHIFYTLCTDVTCPPTPRKLDITCCDLEPAVLARNILLYTLLEDDVPSNHIWDIFHHFKIGDHAFGLIKSQSRKLVELSETPESWRQSQYGSFLKIMTASSLSELRDYWKKYADFSELPADRLDKLRTQCDSLSKTVSGQAKKSVFIDASRSAGNSWMEAVEPVSAQFAHYWEHGTTATTSKELKKVTRLNPTFCYSSLGESFEITTSTFPRGYHFAPAFTPLILDPAGPATDSTMGKAKQQLKAGLSAFQASRQADSIILRFFIGDALALCRALARYSKNQDTDIQEFTAPWRATIIDLSEHGASSPTPPLFFDVIDCSFPGSDLGLINLLLLGQPLLKKQPASQAVLYTDMPMQPVSSIYRFLESLCNSASTVGIFIGLAPRPVLSLFTSLSNTHELTMSVPNPTYAERIAWVDPAAGDEHSRSESDQTTLYFDNGDLKNQLLGFYCMFFANDTLTPNEIVHMAESKPNMLRHYSDVHYTREVIITLLRHAMTRFCLTPRGGWERVLEFLFLAIPHHAKKSHIDFIHELEDHHLLHGLHYKKFDQELGERVARAEVFKDWINPLPRLVYVVLTVPYDKLDLLRQDDSDPSPRLVCYLINPAGVQPRKVPFESIQATWGKCVPVENSDGAYMIEEGPPGFRNDSKSDLVISFWTNVEKLTPTGLVVTLSLLDAPLTRVRYRSKLDDDLTLFSTKITDNSHVLALKDRPTSNPRPQKAVRDDPPTLVAARGTRCELIVTGEQDGSQIRQMKAYLQVESESGRNALAKGAKASTKQIGPCTFQVLLNQAKYTVKFPYPVQNSAITIKVHKASYEIELLSTNDFIKCGGYPTNWFPVLKHTTFSPWNIHHVHPNRLPLIDIQQKDKLQWLIPHANLQMTDRKLLIQRSTHPTERSLADALVNIKESLMYLVLDYVGLRQRPVRLFALTDMTHGYYCHIFILGLRLDLAGGTVVLDAALVPVHLKGAEELSPAINILNNSGQNFIGIRNRPAEVVAWKHLLPAFVERCRTWSHKANCEYKATGKAPLGVEPEVNPLCSCGHGIGLDGPEWDDPAWKACRLCATRAAISPLFGVSYLEQVAGPASKLQEENLWIPAFISNLLVTYTLKLKIVLISK